MSADDPNTLVSTQWLAEHLQAPDVQIVDASWYLPDMGRDAKAEYMAAHIPGAVYFDIDEICDTDSPHPHMLPSQEKFSSRVRRLGLGDGNRIIVYDGLGMFSAARVWWMFRAMGHADVAVLDGGFPKWRAEDRPVEDLPPPPEEVATDISSAPTFTPFTVAPSILNRSDVVRAMEREYPPLLRDAGIGGTVRVFFFIDENGQVQDFRIDQSSGHQALDDAALAVADVYRFTAALNRDKKVPVWVSFPITFQVR